MKLRWIDTLGGPHLLIPIEELENWNGIRGWKDGAPDDTSDYWRACEVEEWVGTIPCGQFGTVVLSGDHGPIAWLPRPDLNGGFLIQWIGAGSDEQILEFANSEAIFSSLSDKEYLETSFVTGPSGRLRLMDSSDGDGEYISPFYEIQVSPGTYLAKAGYYSNKDLMLVVRLLSHTS